MRPTRGEAALATGAALLGASGVALEQVDAVPLAAAAALGAALGLVPRRPRAAWIAAVLVLLAAAPFAADRVAIWLLVAAHAFAAARYESSRAGLAAAAALIAGVELGVAFDAGSAVPAFLLPAAAWGAGHTLREREQVAAALAQRARELDDEREAYAALSVRYERARIASELHDIVAHAISVMVVQAGAGQRLAHDPEATAETFRAIAGAARQAEQDMGRLVALLGDEDAIGPAPDIELVEELVARAAGSGLAVTLLLEGEREGLPAPVVALAYRVVQEGLTNALRYAAGAPVTVAVRGEADALVVDVANGPAKRDVALAGAGTGNGLRGLRERANACGGTVEAGAEPGGGWRLRARLPRRVAVGA